MPKARSNASSQVSKVVPCSKAKDNVVVNLNNLHHFRHFSFAWFVRYALLLTLNNDIFSNPEGITPLLSNNLTTINTAIKNAKGLEELTIDDFELCRKITTEQFMSFEMKEFYEQFGGAGNKVRDAFYASNIVYKLYNLGKSLTTVGSGTYLFLEGDPSVIKSVYSTVRDYISIANKNDQVGEVSILVGSAARVIHYLIIKNLRSQIDSIIKNGMIMYRVSDSGATVNDLTELIRSVYYLRIYYSINELTNLIGKYDFAVKLLNDISDAVIKYVNARTLLPIYEVIRHLISLNESDKSKNLLSNDWERIIEGITMINPVINTIYY